MKHDDLARGGEGRSSNRRKTDPGGYFGRPHEMLRPWVGERSPRPKEKKKAGCRVSSTIEPEKKLSQGRVAGGGVGRQKF